MNKTATLLSLLLAAPLVLAQEPAPVPEPPELPPQVESGKVMESEVTIVPGKDGKGTIHKYSRNGKVYMVKVVPEAGPPYYFLDTDGDGVLDARTSEVTDVNIHQWEILSW
jgi:hypothetical protein